MIGTVGLRSEGLRMNALPQAIAGEHIHNGIIAGKLNGVTPAVTPNACFIEYISMPGPAPSVYSPFSSCGAPMQYSTTSRPRITSPLASGRVLPCCSDRASASLSMSRCRRSTIFIITRARRCGFTAAHAGCAASAALTAMSISSREASGVCAITSPIAGLYTSAKRPDVPLTCSPLM